MHSCHGFLTNRSLGVGDMPVSSEKDRRVKNKRVDDVYNSRRARIYSFIHILEFRIDKVVPGSQ
jgi:hypothetical protein